MKVVYPDKPEYDDLTRGFPPIIKVKRSEGRIEVISPIGWEINGKFHKLSQRKLKLLRKAEKNLAKKFQNFAVQ